jgi:hypothetical protein
MLNSAMTEWFLSKPKTSELNYFSFSILSFLTDFPREGWHQPSFKTEFDAHKCFILQQIHKQPKKGG